LFSSWKLDVASKWPLNKINRPKTNQNDLKQRRSDLLKFSAPLMDVSSSEDKEEQEWSNLIDSDDQCWRAAFVAFVIDE
jgi:hypothetical protein